MARNASSGATEATSPWWAEVDAVGAFDAKGGARRWKCRYCFLVKTGGADRVRSHLTQEKGNGIAICQFITAEKVEGFKRMAKALDDAKAAAKARQVAPSAAPTPIRRTYQFNAAHMMPIGPTSPLSHSASTTTPGGSGIRSASSVDAPFSSMDPPSSGRARQASLAATWHPHRRAQVDGAVARFFYSCGISFNAARSPYFQEMVREIATYGPSYIPPTYDALRTKLLENEVSAITEACAPIKQQWQRYGTSLIGDGWSDTRSRSIQGILASTRGKTYFIKSIDNSEGGKTAERIAEIWGEAIEYVGPQNVLQFIADGENANRAAGRLLEARYPNLFWTPCLAHGLNNLMKDIGKLDWVLPTIESGREIVNFITRHHYILAIFRKIQTKPKELLKYSETRFGYNFIMLKRLHEVKNALRQLVVSDDWMQWALHSSTAGVLCSSIILNNEFWEEVSHLTKLAGPIIRMMRLVDGDEPCLGKVYEGMDRMIEHIQEVETNEERLGVLKDLAISRWNSYYVPLQAAAYVLDPEFQGKGQEFDREVVRGWEATLKKLVPDSDQRRAIKDQLAIYRKKEGLFGYEDAQKDRFKVSSTTWWEDYGADTSLLQQLAIRILSHGASSSPCERLWSSFGHIASKKRNRLGTMKANDLVFVNANLRLLNQITGAPTKEKYIGWEDGDGAHSHDSDDSVEVLEELHDDATHVASTSYSVASPTFSFEDF